MWKSIQVWKHDASNHSSTMIRCTGSYSFFILSSLLLQTSIWSQCWPVQPNALTFQLDPASSGNTNPTLHQKRDRMNKPTVPSRVHGYWNNDRQTQSCPFTIKLSYQVLSHFWATRELSQRSKKARTAVIQNATRVTNRQKEKEVIKGREPLGERCEGRDWMFEADRQLLSCG